MEPKKEYRLQNTIFEVIREQLGLNKADFSRELGVSRMHYHARIAGGSRLPSDMLLKAFELSGWTEEEFGLQLLKCIRRELAAEKRRSKW